MSDSNRPRVIVTGGASGIGAATVARFQSDGANVAVIDANAAAVGGLTDVIAVVGDVTDEQAIKTAIDDAVSQLGGLDVLVCAAGISGGSTVEETSLDEWERVFAVNVRGVFLTCKAGLAHLGEGGAIVNVASMLGLVGYPTHNKLDEGAVAYCASKGAVVQLTRAMAINCIQRGIRVNAVAPGITQTAMLESHYESDDSLAAHVRATHPQGRMVTPEEVADGISYLASPRASSTVGTILSVDGGYTAW